MAEKQTYTGIVRQANDTGIKLDGMDHWLNKSSKGDGAALTLPQVGEYVTVVATPWKDRLYIHSLAVNGVNGNGKAHPNGNGHLPQAAPVTAQEGQGTAEGHGEAPEYPSSPDRDRRITRLAVLNTAATVLTHNLPAGEPIRAETLEALAWRLEQWVYRPQA